MELVVKKPDLDDLNEDGIPKEIAEAIAYWNYGVKSQEGMFRFIPRRTEISVDEVKRLFVPAILEGKSIHLVAKHGGRVVGTITAIYDVGMTEYEHRGERKPGDIGESVDPRVNGFEEILGVLYEGLKRELKKLGRTARAVFPVEDEKSLGVLRSLGYTSKEIEHEPYKEIGLSGKGIEFEIG